MTISVSCNGVSWKICPVIIPTGKWTSEFSPLETLCLHCRSPERNATFRGLVMMMMFSKWRMRSWMKATFQMFFNKRRYKFTLGFVLLFNLELKHKVWYSVVFSSPALLPLIFPLSSLKKAEGRNPRKINGPSFWKGAFIFISVQCFGLIKKLNNVQILK